MKLVNSLKIIEQLQLWDKAKDKYIRFILWKKQIEFLKLIHTKRLIIILKKRQTGISQLTGADSLIQAMFRENFTVLVLSITGGEAEEYLKRIRDMYRMYDDEIKQINPCVKGEEAGDEIVFASGSRIISLSAQKGRGRTGNRIIIDEAAFITKKLSHTDLEEVLKANEAVVEKAEGQIILISTANGPNKFKQMYLKAINKISSYTPFFFSCWDDPTFTKAMRAQIVKDHGEDHANQEHPRTWQEAFLASGRLRFDKPALEYYAQKMIAKPLLVGNITTQGIEITEEGNIKFFSKKDIRGQYFISADVAEGLEHGDNSIAKVFNIKTQEQVAEWSGHCEPSEFGTILYFMGRHYNNAYIAPEANNHGHATIIQLKNVHEYPEELIFESNYIKERPDDDFNIPEKRYGWQTTNVTKKLIIDKMAQELIKKQLPKLSIEDIEEFYTYIIDAKGATNADTGMKDDRVMAWAIGRYLLPFYEIKEYQDYQKCINCEHLYKDKMLCGKTERNCKSNEICSMFREPYFEIDQKELEKLRKKAYLITSGGQH